MITRLVDVAAGAVVTTHRALGAGCDRAAALLDETAAGLRWLAVLCRVAP